MTLNLLIDSPPSDPDPLETLPSAWQMSLVDLKAHDLRYTARLMRRDDLTREERQHWGEIVSCLESHDNARRWTWQRRNVAEGEAMPHPLESTDPEVVAAFIEAWLTV